MYPGITAATHPQRPAVIQAETGKVTTFLELHEAAIRLSNVLRAAGLQPGDHVGEVVHTLRGASPAAGGVKVAAFVCVVEQSHISSSSSGGAR